MLIFLIILFNIHKIINIYNKTIYINNLNKTNKNKYITSIKIVFNGQIFHCAILFIGIIHRKCKTLKTFKNQK